MTRMTHASEGRASVRTALFALLFPALCLAAVLSGAQEAQAQARARQNRRCICHLQARSPCSRSSPACPGPAATEASCSPTACLLGNCGSSWLRHEGKRRRNWKHERRPYGTSGAGLMQHWCLWLFGWLFVIQYLPQRDLTYQRHSCCSQRLLPAAPRAFASTCMRLDVCSLVAARCCRCLLHHCQRGCRSSRASRPPPRRRTVLQAH